MHQVYYYTLRKLARLLSNLQYLVLFNTNMLKVGGHRLVLAVEIFFEIMIIKILAKVYLNSLILKKGFVLNS